MSQHLSHALDSYQLHQAAIRDAAVKLDAKRRRDAAAREVATAPTTPTKES